MKIYSYSELIPTADNLAQNIYEKADLLFYKAENEKIRVLMGTEFLKYIKKAPLNLNSYWYFMLGIHPIYKRILIPFQIECGINEKYSKKNLLFKARFFTFCYSVFEVQDIPSKKSMHISLCNFIDHFCFEKSTYLIGRERNIPISNLIPFLLFPGSTLKNKRSPTISRTHGVIEKQVEKMCSYLKTNCVSITSSAIKRTIHDILDKHLEEIERHHY